MLPIGNRLLVIKERSVYEFRLADDIDPQRENPDVPLTSQRLLVNLGTESEMFSRTFLTAKRLFKAGYLPSIIDIPKLLLLTLEIVQEMAVLDKELEDYLNQEKKVSGDYEDRKRKKLDHAVPSIPDVKTRCKTIFQKSDHVLQLQLRLIRNFYPDFSMKSYYDKLIEFIENRHGDQDGFTLFLKQIHPFILLVRNVRNCLDHLRIETKITDFELEKSTNILAPTIEVEYNGSKLERTSLSAFLIQLPINLIEIFENMIAYLCSKNVIRDRILNGQVLLIPEEKRINKNIKFAYWLPIGEGGFYQQI